MDPELLDHDRPCQVGNAQRRPTSISTTPLPSPPPSFLSPRSKVRAAHYTMLPVGAVLTNELERVLHALDKAAAGTADD
jgi:hypothetical protein